MHLTTATVGYHVERLKRLTGQRNGASLVAFAFTHEILGPGREFKPGSARSELDIGDFVPTNQQRDVIVYLARGASYTMIADTMHITSATIGYHVDRLKRLTEARNAASLVAFGFVHRVLRIDRWPVELAPTTPARRGVA